jgi:HlyD family secretion protein
MPGALDMKKKIIPILVILVVLAAVFLYFRNRSPVDPDRIRVSGNIEMTEAEVSFKIPGRVEERLVAEGESVTAGQVVARLDSRELVQEKALRQAQVGSAQAALAELQAGSRTEEIAQAQALLERAQADRERAQVEFERQKRLYQREVISTREYDLARTTHDGAEARVREAREYLALVKKGPRREKIDQARASLRASEQVLAQAQTRLEYTVAVSPLSGIVLSKNIEPGEVVSAGTPVVTVGEVSQVFLRAYINETDLGRVKVGQKVKVTTDTFPGKSYEGHISFLAPQAEFTPKNIQTQKERVKLVYRIKVEIPNPKMELKPGMPADGEILLNEKK